MEFIDNLKDLFDDFIERTSRLTVTILAILLFLFISAVMVLIYALTSSEKRKMEDVRTPLSAEDSFIPPSQMKLTQDYYFSRNQGKEWEREESDRWFSKPNSVNMNELHQANEQIVDEIIGAAP